MAGRQQKMDEGDNAAGGLGGGRMGRRLSSHAMRARDVRGRSLALEHRVLVGGPVGFELLRKVTGRAGRTLGGSVAV
jgi:hypothetical protein